MAEDIRTIFNAPDRETAKSYRKKMVEKYTDIAPALADWSAQLFTIISVFTDTIPSLTFKRFSFDTMG